MSLNHHITSARAPGGNGITHQTEANASDESVQSAQFAFQNALVEVFSELADLFGNPRSHGQIYGLLFCSSEPLTMDEIARLLGISIGSASQGLRVLEEIGAVERDSTHRLATFTAKAELKNLISGFVRRRLVPRLEANLSRLHKLQAEMDAIPGADVGQYRWRLERVTKWHRRALEFLPIARKLIGDP